MSLSKNRIGLICSSREYRKDYFGVPERGGKDFAFLALLITPETKEEMRREVKCLSAIKDVELELCLRRRKSRKAYFFDLEKLSTQLR